TMLRQPTMPHRVHHRAASWDTRRMVAAVSALRVLFEKAPGDSAVGFRAGWNSGYSTLRLTCSWRVWPASWGSAGKATSAHRPARTRYSSGRALRVGKKVSPQPPQSSSLDRAVSGPGSSTPRDRALVSAAVASAFHRPLMLSTEEENGTRTVSP